MKKLFSRFDKLYRRIGAKGNSKEVFDLLNGMYSEKWRAYHNLSHIENCLSEFDDAMLLLRRSNEAETALWFHDAVYNTKEDFNEEKSAQFANNVLREKGIGKTFSCRVGRLILATRHYAMPRGLDFGVITDIDLSILGKSAREFDEYEKAIRKEYSWASEKDFIVGRMAFLESMLKRQGIFSTDFFRERYEAKARKNIQRSMEKMKREKV